MALFDLETNKRITDVSFPQDFRTWRDRLTEGERDAIDAWIDERIEGNTIHTAGWMPGSDWTGTPLEPIYTKSARRNQELAGKAFGLFVYARFIAHAEDWISGRFEKDGREIGSRTYFKKTR